MSLLHINTPGITSLLPDIIVIMDLYYCNNGAIITVVMDPLLL